MKKVLAGLLAAVMLLGVGAVGAVGAAAADDAPALRVIEIYNGAHITVKAGEAVLLKMKDGSPIFEGSDVQYLENLSVTGYYKTDAVNFGYGTGDHQIPFYYNVDDLYNNLDGQRGEGALVHGDYPGFKSTTSNNRVTVTYANNIVLITEGQHNEDHTIRSSSGTQYCAVYLAPQEATEFECETFIRFATLYTNGASGALLKEENVEIIPGIRFKVTVEAVGYTLTYDPLGGVGGPGKQTGIKAGTTVDLSEAKPKPTREGYIFMGWSLYLGNNGLALEPNSSVVMNRDMTAYAIWLEASSWDKFVDWLYNTPAGTAIKFFTDTAVGKVITAVVNPVVSFFVGVITMFFDGTGAAW